MKNPEVRHCVVYFPPQQMAPPASASLKGVVLGGGGPYWFGIWDIARNFWKVLKIFIAGDASPWPPVCFASYLIDDINANWG